MTAEKNGKAANVRYGMDNRGMHSLLLLSMRLLSRLANAKTVNVKIIIGNNDMVAGSAKCAKNFLSPSFSSARIVEHLLVGRVASRQGQGIWKSFVGRESSNRTEVLLRTIALRTQDNSTLWATTYAFDQLIDRISN